MATKDRRSGLDRRRVRRAMVAREIEWENHTGRRRGTLSDISRRGCFVLASGDFAIGERLYIHLPLVTGSTLRLPAEVRTSIFEIGFAAQFRDLSNAEAEFLERFVELNQ